MTQKIDNLTVAQSAYLAGFLDGDGSLTAQIVPDKTRHFKFYIRLSILYIQKTKRVYYLKKINDEIGNLGRVREKPDSKGVSELAIDSREQVAVLLEKLQPYLRIKSKQSELMKTIASRLPSVLKKQDKGEFLKLCKLTDEIAAYNDSRNRINDYQTVKAYFEKNLNFYENETEQ